MAPSVARTFWRAIATKVRNRMVDVLNRRSYMRNLLREMDEVLAA